MHRALVALAVALAACGAMRPELDPKEHVRGERRRAIPIPFERFWPMVVAALPTEGVRVTRADAARRAITTAPVRFHGNDAAKRLAEIGDLSRVRRAGLGRVSDLEVTFYLLLAPAGDSGTTLRVRSAIEAIDRGVSFLGPGIFGVVPRRVEVPSRGVVEQELVRRLAAGMFTVEEMLFLLGEPGVD